MQVEGRNNTLECQYLSLDDNGNISIHQIKPKEEDLKKYFKVDLVDFTIDMPILPGNKYIAYSYLCKTHQIWEVKNFIGNRLNTPNIQRELALAKLANDCMLFTVISHSRIGRSSFITAASILNLIHDLPLATWGIAVTVGRQDVTTIIPIDIITCLNKFVRSSYLVREANSFDIPLAIRHIYTREADKEYILASNQWKLVTETQDGAIISHPIISLPANQWEHPSEFKLLLLPDVSHDDKGYMIRIPPRMSNVDTARKWLYRAKKTDKFVKEV